MNVLIILAILALSLACPDNCYDCDYMGTICFACNEGFELSVTASCVDANNVLKCALYGPANQCFACQPTYTLANGQCLKDSSACLALDPAEDTSCTQCGFGTVLQNKKCVGAINCKSESATCPKCEDGFTL